MSGYRIIGHASQSAKRENRDANFSLARERTWGLTLCALIKGLIQVRDRATFYLGGADGNPKMFL